MTVYEMINWFFLYSFFGYLLECIVLSLEYKRLVMDRGFGHGPFCIIYGFGAVGAYVFLYPFLGYPVKLFLASMTMATIMELITAGIMIRLFGSFWWDYSRKLFNYRGIICLESSIGWGFLGIIFFRYLDQTAHLMLSYVPEVVEGKLAVALLSFYVLDFTYCMYIRLNGKDHDDTDGVGRLKVN